MNEELDKLMKEKLMPFRQACEQAEAAARDFGPVLGAYRRTLTKAGFTRQEALALVVDFQRIMFGLGQAAGGGGNR